MKNIIEDTIINVSENEVDTLRKMYRSIHSSYQYPNFYPDWVSSILLEEWCIFKNIVTLYPKYVIMLFEKPFEDVPLISMITKPIRDIDYYGATIKWRLTIGK